MWRKPTRRKCKATWNISRLKSELETSYKPCQKIK